MKKQIFWLFFLFISVKLFSQNFTEEHFKYWYYRERLRCFVYPGIGDGCSVIATYRNPVFALNDLYYSENYKTINYGQTFKSMGYYPGMLATEDRLLIENGQNCDAIQTLSELELALDALIRMDKYSTPHFLDHKI